MSVTYLNGFEAGATAFYSASGIVNLGGWWANVDNTVAKLHRTLAGAGGNYCLGVRDVTTIVFPTYDTTSRFLHFYFRPVGGTGSLTIYFYATADATPTNTAVIDSSGIARLYRDTGTLLATAATAVAHWASLVGFWVAIEDVARDAPNGLLTLYVDGVQYVTTGAADTQGSATQDWETFATRFSVYDCAYDDIVVTDNNTGLQAEWFLQVQVPESNVAGCALTPVPAGAGTNWERVNEIPADTVDYCEATAVGQEDTYETTNPATAPVTILAVCAWSWCGRDGAITQARTGIEEGGATAYRAYKALPAAGTYETIWQVATVNPNTLAAWTPAEVNALRLHIQFN